MIRKLKKEPEVPLTKTNPETEQDSVTEDQHQFFDKVSLLELSGDKKSNIAQEIIADTFGDKLYRLELVLSCVVATLGLLTNSIPVVIGAMLIAPILQPIKALSFATTTGSKSIYLKALRMLGLSILVAVATSYLITRLVPFAEINKEILARTAPTIVDLMIALASGIIAVLSLGFRRLSEGIAGVAMAVALMPPLSVIGIGLFFLNSDIAIGSLLLFLTNLVAIIIVGIIIFYLFGFFPTNKKGQKRSAMMSLLVVITIAMITVPLRKGMQSIAQDYKTNAILNTTFENFLSEIDSKISFTNIEYQKTDDSILRVKGTLNVPSYITLTDEHKTELTQRLAIATQTSVELELDLIDFSSVYIELPTEPTKEEILKNRVNTYLNNLTGVIFIDSKVAKQPKTVVLITLFNQLNSDKERIFTELEEEVKAVFGEEATLLIERQKNTRDEITTTVVDLEPEEELINEQFNLFFTDSELKSLIVDFGQKNIPDSENSVEKFISDLDTLSGAEAELQQHFIQDFSGTVAEYDSISVYLHFATPEQTYFVKNSLASRKTLLESIFQTQVNLQTKVEYFSKRDL